MLPVHRATQLGAVGEAFALGRGSSGLQIITPRCEPDWVHAGGTDGGGGAGSHSGYLAKNHAEFLPCSGSHGRVTLEGR